MSQIDKLLSPLEWEIMIEIWKIGGSPSVRDVIESVYPNGEKAYTTVQTIMNNLEAKGVLSKTKIGLVNFYKPVKRQSELVGKETKNFVNKIFNGSFQSLANYLIDSNSLSEDEIENLRRVIEQKEDKK